MLILVKRYEAQDEHLAETIIRRHFILFYQTSDTATRPLVHSSAQRRIPSRRIPGRFVPTRGFRAPRRTNPRRDRTRTPREPSEAADDARGD